MKRILKTSIVVALLLGLCLAGLGTGYGGWTRDLVASGDVNTGGVGVEFVSYTCSDVPGEPDMGNTKDVAQCACALLDSDGDGDSDMMQIEVTGAYPCYQCLFSVTVGNNATVPVYITDTSLIDNSGPGALALEGFWTDTNLVGTLLYPGESVSGGFWLHVTNPASQNATYTFLARIQVTQWGNGFEPQDLGGTIGFWKNWDSHNTYEQGDIEGWLGMIATNSLWLGPATIAGMEGVLKGASGGTAEEKFLGHYLATRLDAEAGRLLPDAGRDVTGLDEDNYLGLSDPAATTLGEIIDAIEAKYGTASPEFEVMKDICDALNNLDI